MNKTFWLLASGSWLLLLLPACQREWVFEAEVTVSPGGIEAVVIEPPAKEANQRVMVHVRSPGVPVHTYMIPDSDRESFVKKIQEGKPALGRFLANPAHGEKTGMAVLIEPQSKFAVVLHNKASQAATVSIRATGKK